MRDPAREKQRRPRLRQTLRLKSQVRKEIARMVNGHNHHDCAPQEINRRNPSC